jgi:hypothetical protein
MKNLVYIVLLSACVSFSGVSAEPDNANAATQVPDFLIDLSKPYVYLEVDDVGARKPLREGEPNVGIWLHLVNNCRLPIVIVALEVPPADPNAPISIEDEVVPNPQGPGGDGLGGGTYVQAGIHDLKEMDDIFHSPNLNEAEVRGAEWALKRTLTRSQQKNTPERPHGYSSGHGPGVQMLTLIPPGGKVFFSVPANHVSKTWHFEIPFRFGLKRQGLIRQPYSYVAFFWDDLPEAYRISNAVPGL